MAQTPPYGSSYASFAVMIGGIVLSAYFAFAAVQGDYGLFRRLKAEAQAEDLIIQLAALEEEIEVLENRTRRLSDDYLDLDLLDERARRVLGLIRADEIAVR